MFAADHVQAAEKLYVLASSMRNYPSRAFRVIESGIFIASLAAKLAASAARSTGQISTRDRSAKLLREMSSNLSLTKTVIEYQNYRIPHLQRNSWMLQMDRYNRALEQFRQANTEAVRREIQAGIICLHFAEKLLEQNNEVISTINVVQHHQLSRSVLQLVKISEELARLSTTCEHPGTGQPTDSYIKAIASFEVSITNFVESGKAEPITEVWLQRLRDGLSIPGARSPIPQSSQDSISPTRIRMIILSSQAQRLSLALLNSTKIDRAGALSERLNRINYQYKRGIDQLDLGNREAAKQLISSALLELNLLKSTLIGLVKSRKRRDD